MRRPLLVAAAIAAALLGAVPEAQRAHLRTLYDTFDPPQYADAAAWTARAA